MRSMLLFFLMCALLVSPNAFPGGGGGDGSGLDILPSFYWFDKDQGIVHPSTEPEYWGYLFYEDALNGTQVQLNGPDTSLTATFLPAITDGEGHLRQPVALSGLSHGQVIVSTGYAVPDSSGRLCLMDNEMKGCEWLVHVEPGNYWFRFYMSVDPLEFEDGDHYDDFAGSMTWSRNGVPKDRGIMRY